MTKPLKRDISGILLLDKPIGISSNAALQQVKRLYQARKAGHTGSLDNLASGLLPICLGEATKVSGYLLDSDKRYRTTCTLGETTTTADAEGEITRSRAWAHLDVATIQAALPGFLGAQSQVPPMYSALKRQGQPLYKLARRGEVVEREPRDIQIYALTLLGLTDNRLELEVHCSKGTYIRTLVEDLGEVLGCGAHVSVLRRLGVKHFQNMIDFATLHQLAEQGLTALDAQLLPIETALPDWPAVYLPADLVHWVQQGQAVQVPHAPSQGPVKIMTEDLRFLGIGEVLDDGRVAPRRLVHSAGTETHTT